MIAERVFRMKNGYSSAVRLWIMFCCLEMSFVLGQTVSSTPQGCTSVSRAYASMGYRSSDVPMKPFLGTVLRVCSRVHVTCCTSDMEMNMASQSRRVFDSSLANTTEPIRTVLVTTTKNFNDFFIQLLDKGQQELHEMFSMAYGLQYRQNEEVFKQLFADFQQYYNGASLDLSNSIRKFFGDVFRRMFVLQNPEYEFSDAYLQCVEAKMDTLLPFGKDPEVLQRNIRQAFVAARAFVQGLAVGRNAALSMAKVEPTAWCLEGHMRMTNCRHCSGLPTLKPCFNYCLNVMKGCLAYHAEIQEAWSKYIVAMEELAIRLEGEGAFNMEAVVGPLKDRISSAIMEYHGSSKAVSAKIFEHSGCGPPRPAGRSKRASKPAAPKPAAKQGTQNAGTRSKTLITLNVLLRDVKVELRKMKTVWIDLPAYMCSDVAGPNGTSECWNGASNSSYTQPLMQDGLLNNKNNPEVKLDSLKATQLITDQIQALRKMANLLENARQGINVDWLNLDIPAATVSPTPKLTMAVGPPDDEGGDIGSGVQPKTPHGVFTDTKADSVDIEGSGRSEAVPSRLAPSRGMTIPKTKLEVGRSDTVEKLDNKPIALPIIPSQHKDVHHPSDPDNDEGSAHSEGSGTMSVNTDDEDGDVNPYISDKVKPVQTSESSARRTRPASTTPKNAAVYNNNGVLTMLTLLVLLPCQLF